MKNKKEAWIYIIALLIGIICIILSIANFWLKNDTIEFIIWPLLLLSMMFNCLGTSIDNQKLMSRYTIKTLECFDWCWALISIEHKIRCMDISQELKGELIDYIQEQNEEVHQQRRKNMKQFNVKEDEL